MEAKRYQRSGQITDNEPAMGMGKTGKWKNGDPVPFKRKMPGKIKLRSSDRKNEKQDESYQSMDLDSTFLEFRTLFLRTFLAPELRFVIMRPVVISRPDQAVSPGDFTAVHTGDILLNFPLGSETLGGDDELVYPEEDQPANQVRDNSCNPLAHRYEKNSYHGEQGGACLPPQQVKSVALVIDLHTDEWCARMIGVAMKTCLLNGNVNSALDQSYSISGRP